MRKQPFTPEEVAMKLSELFTRLAAAERELFAIRAGKPPTPEFRAPPRERK